MSYLFWATSGVTFISKWSMSGLLSSISFLVSSYSFNAGVHHKVSFFHPQNMPIPSDAKLSLMPSLLSSSFLMFSLFFSFCLSIVSCHSLDLSRPLISVASNNYNNYIRPNSLSHIVEENWPDFGRVPINEFQQYES